MRRASGSAWWAAARRVHRRGAPHRGTHRRSLRSGGGGSVLDAEKSRQSGAELGLNPSRVYDDFKSMAIREARLKDGIEAVAIVTPNHMHYPGGDEFLKRGIHVICDKPLTSNLADAKKL